MVNRRQAKKAAETKARIESQAQETKETVVAKSLSEVAKQVEEPVVSEAESVVSEQVESATKKVVAKAKKTTTKKEIKTTLFVEYFGKQVQEKDMIAAVKKAWTKSGKKIGDIKTMSLYVKPEEDAVYYVINDEVSGRVDF